MKKKFMLILLITSICNFANSRNASQIDINEFNMYKEKVNENSNDIEESLDRITELEYEVQDNTDAIEKLKELKNRVDNHGIQITTNRNKLKEFIKFSNNKFDSVAAIVHTQASQNKVVSDKLKEHDDLISKNNQSIRTISTDLNDYKSYNDARVNKAINGVATAVAIANLTQVSYNSIYSNNLSAAYGFFGGSHAIALGISGTTSNDRFSYKISTAFNTKGNLAIGLGIGINFGQKKQTNQQLLDRIEKLEQLVKQLSK